MTVDFWASLIDLEVSGFPLVDSQTTANSGNTEGAAACLLLSRQRPKHVCAALTFRRATGKVASLLVL